MKVEERETREEKERMRSGKAAYFFAQKII